VTVNVKALESRIQELIAEKGIEWVLAYFKASGFPDDLLIRVLPDGSYAPVPVTVLQ
jgi:hypothetical protein